MNCPKCGGAIAEGKACCDNPVGAAFSFDFVRLARWAAVLIAALALAAVYFLKK